MKTQREIVEKYRKEVKKDSFGFAGEAYLSCLDFEQAKEFLRPEATEADWNQVTPLTEEAAVRKSAIEYLTFAWGKAEDHRGISANRSVAKMEAYLFILGLDTTSFEAAGYAQYGCPKLKEAAIALGQPLPTDPELVRMMNGETCTPECESGCA